MDHGMAIGAKRTEVSNGINRVGATHIGNGDNMMHVNVPATYFTIAVLKVKPADHTGSAIVRDARITRGTVALVGVDPDLSNSSLNKYFRMHLIGAAKLLRIVHKGPKYGHWRLS